MAYSTFTINDYSDEKSSFRVGSVALTAANFDAQIAAELALSNAIVDLTIGDIVKRVITQVNLDDPEIPTNPFAQREMKWLVTYVGNTSGKRYTLEIAAPDLTDNLSGNTDLADLTSTDWEAFVTAFESFARAPDNITETVTVLSARVVGRNI